MSTQVNKLKRKKAQMQLSFGFIFSIILIIVFFAFAIYGIIKFLDFQKHTKIAQFFVDFQEDVDNMWQTTYGSEIRTYNLPDKIEKVCLTSDSEIMFEPFGSGMGVDPVKINHLDIETIIARTEQGRNYYCINTDRGKVKIKIEQHLEDKTSLIDISAG